MAQSDATTPYESKSRLIIWRPQSSDYEIDIWFFSMWWTGCMCSMGLLCFNNHRSIWSRSDASAIRIFDIGSGRPGIIVCFRMNYTLLWQSSFLSLSEVPLKGVWVKEHHNLRGASQRWFILTLLRLLIMIGLWNESAPRFPTTK
jgi:hypothetical protein